MKPKQMALTLIPSGQEPPSEFRIWAFGTVETSKGNFTLTPENAALIVADAADHGADLYIDWEHSHLGTQDGKDSPAAGWFNLEVREDGLYATNVRWTTKAAQQLSAGEYRYYSPLFAVDEAGQIVGFLNMALTNTPATKRLAPLIAASKRLGDLYSVVEEALERAYGMSYLIEVFTDYAVFAVPSENGSVVMRCGYTLTPTGEITLDDTAVQAEIEYTPIPQGATMNKLMIALALSATATEEVGVARATQLVGLSKTIATLTGEQDPAKQEAALMALSQKAAQADALNTRVDKLEKDARAAEVAELIATGKREGKLPPALVDWASEQAPEALRVFLSKAPVAVGAPPADEGAVTEVVALSQEQRKIADQLGIPHVDYLSSLQAETRAGVVGG